MSGFLIMMLLAIEIDVRRLNSAIVVKMMNIDEAVPNSMISCSNLLETSSLSFFPVIAKFNFAKPTDLMIVWQNPKR